MLGPRVIGVARDIRVQFYPCMPAMLEVGSFSKTIGFDTKEMMMMHSSGSLNNGQT